jgi:hypothetical protein
MALVLSTFELGERSMADVDVLVPPSRWEEACALLVQAGFRINDAPDRDYTTTHDYVRSFTSAHGVAIEVHRFLCEETMFAIRYEGEGGIFSRAREISPGVSLPAPEDLFLSLAAHAAKHTFDLPLRSYLDGVALSRRFALSADEMVRRAREWQMEMAFHAWMRCLTRLTGDVDGDGRRVGSLRTRSGRAVWSHTAHSSPWQRFVRLAWLMDGWGRWSRHVVARAAFRVRDLRSSRHQVS